MLLRRFVAGQAEIVLEIELRFRVAFDGSKIHYQAVFDGKSDVVIDVRVAAIENLRDERFVALMRRRMTVSV